MSILWCLKADETETFKYTEVYRIKGEKVSENKKVNTPPTLPLSVSPLRRHLNNSIAF